MPRRDRFDDDERDDYRDRPPKKSGNSTMLIGILVGGGAVAAFLVIACVVAILVWGKGQPPNPPNANDAVIKPAGGKEGEKKSYTRDEFKKLAVGKTSEQLIATFGRPDMTFDHEDSSPRRWYYRNRVLNPATNKVEGVWINFSDGKSESVEW